MNNISLYLTAGCLGIIVFFLIILVPTIFKVLDKESVSKYLRAFFPKFYLFLFLLSGLAALISQETMTTFTLSVVSIGFLLSRWPLTSVINNSTDSKNKKMYKFWHGFIVIILLIQIVLMSSLFFINK